MYVHDIEQQSRHINVDDKCIYKYSYIHIFMDIHMYVDNMFMSIYIHIHIHIPIHAHIPRVEWRGLTTFVRYNKACVFRKLT